MGRQFPELALQRPKVEHNLYYWWPLTPEGDAKRVAAMEECIRMTDDTLNQNA